MYAGVRYGVAGVVAFNRTECYAFSDHSPVVATFED